MTVQKEPDLREFFFHFSFAELREARRDFREAEGEFREAGGEACE